MRSIIFAAARYERPNSVMTNVIIAMLSLLSAATSAASGNTYRSVPDTYRQSALGVGDSLWSGIPEIEAEFGAEKKFRISATSGNGKPVLVLIEELHDHDPSKISGDNTVSTFQARLIIDDHVTTSTGTGMFVRSMFFVSFEFYFSNGSKTYFQIGWQDYGNSLIRFTGDEIHMEPPDYSTEFKVFLKNEN